MDRSNTTDGSPPCHRGFTSSSSLSSSTPSASSPPSSPTTTPTPQLLRQGDHRFRDSASTPLLGGRPAALSPPPPSSAAYRYDFPSAIMEKFNRFAVPSEPGLTNAQLMLQNEDLKPVEAERRVWTSKNFVFFWISDSFNISMSFLLLLLLIFESPKQKKTATTMKKADKFHFPPNNRHMDDFLFQHRRRLILVAVLALRLGRLRNHRRLRRAHRSHRSEIPPQLSRHRSSILWHLGRSLARPQSRRHGMYMVWCARLDRRDVRLPDDSIDLAFVGCIWSGRE